MQMHALPYWETGAGICVAAQCDGQTTFAVIDTGSDQTNVTTAYVAAHGAHFTSSGNTYDVGSTTDATAVAVGRTADAGVHLLGLVPADDLSLGGVELLELAGMTWDNQAVSPGELGDPSALPYSRSDIAGIAPALSI